MTNRISMTNDSAELVNTRQALEAFLMEAKLPISEITKITLAVDEALANIVEHAEAPSSAACVKIDIDLKEDGESLQIVINDTAEAYDPTRVPDVNVKKHLLSGNKGGLGVYIIRKVMDEVSYEFTPEKTNRLTMVRHHSSPSNN